MKLKAIAALAFTMSLMLASPAGRAQLVDQGNMTLDPVTNLLWLDMSFSVGVSADSILNGTDPNNLLAAGWSFASLSQIQTLVQDAGMFFPGLSSANFAPATTFLSLFGETQPGSIQAYSSDAPPASTCTSCLWTPNVLAITFPDGTGIGGADIPGPPPFGPNATFGSPNTGSWLYMPAPAPVAAVPEPEIYAMMGLGVGLLGWLKRRKISKKAAAA